MKKAHARNPGFTLIELLTVIAIISILTALTAVGLPRVLLKAKMTDVQNTMNQLRTALTVYYTDHGTYPPRYGYIRPADRLTAAADLQTDPLFDDYAFITRPYLAFLGEHQNLDFHDRFSDSGDTDQDRVLSELEFSPIGTRSGDTYTFEGTL